MHSILDTWGISATYLTQVVNDNPSLRGMIVGYLAERKLRDFFDADERITHARKDDDHDRSKKGDVVILYRGHEFKIEVKSLQTNQINIHHKKAWIKKMLKKRDHTASTKTPKYLHYENPDFHSIGKKERLNSEYRGAVQCDASDCREISFPDGTTVKTTLLQVGEFDILAAGLFGYREKWDYGFALNRELPRSTHANMLLLCARNCLKALYL